MAPANGEMPIHFECVRCGACCSQKEMIVPLTGRDLTRLAYALGINAHQMLRVVDFYIQSDSSSFPQGLQETARVRTEKGMAVMALRKDDSGKCIFLENSLCMVHPARPGICRSFPFVFHETANGFSIGLSAMKSICPGLGTGKEVSSTELENLAQEVLEDISIFHEFVREWNGGEISHSASLLIEKILSDIRFIV